MPLARPWYGDAPRAKGAVYLIKLGEKDADLPPITLMVLSSKGSARRWRKYLQKQHTEKVRVEEVF